MRSLRLFHFDIPTWGNFGDKALFPVVRDAFRVLGGTDSGQAEPNFTFASAAALRREVDEAAVARINATADAVVIGGGGLFLQDTNPNRLSGWQWKISAEALAALDVPLIVYAVGDNRFPGQPEFDELMRTHVGQVLDRSAFFGLRNTGSIDTMSRVLGQRERIAFQPCPTTILDHLYAPLAGRRPDPREKTVAIQMLVHARQIAAGYDATTIHEATVRAARILVDKGWTVLSTPFHPDDAAVSARIVAEVAGVEEVRLYGHDVGFFSGLEFFASVPYVLGGRGHAQMIPFGVGSIPVSLDLHAKLGYFAADIGHPELVVPVGPEGTRPVAEAGGADSAASMLPMGSALLPIGSALDRAEAADVLADRMVSGLEEAYSHGAELQADLADTRARFATITAENLAGIRDSLRARSHPTPSLPGRAEAPVGTAGDSLAGSPLRPVGDGLADSPLRAAGDGFAGSPLRAAGDGFAGSPLRAAEDIRAEEFHVAAIAESEEVAAQQARALARADRDLAHARREHTQTLDDVRKRARARLRSVEEDRDDALAESRRHRAEAVELEQRIADISAAEEHARQALEAERGRTAGEVARVLARKIRHGIGWRIRRLTAIRRR
ncbi:polysaccharide pyruvyl transferase family protein [Brevibacterium sp. LE-L]|uniref:polysaccharide pyruvyl transferase family protein n=1 Tax=Brevibacterium sp. LE-L TaxID=3418557 RepID=UPI003CEE2B55